MCCVNLIEWRDSQLQCVDQGVTGVSPGESLLCIGRECQSAKDTDPGDTTDTGLPHKETHFANLKVILTSVCLSSI